MNKLTHSTAAKIVAICLLVICFSLAFAGLCGVAILYDADAYDCGWNETVYNLTGDSPENLIEHSWLAYHFLDDLYRLRFVLIGFAFLLLLISFALFIFLICAAGHRRGQTEVTLNPLDKIPLDLYLCIAALLIFVCCGMLSNNLGMYGGFDEVIELAVIILGGIGLQLIVLAAVLTIATRAKAGGWYRNTVIFYLLRLFGRAWKKLKAMVQQLPLVWRTVLIVGGAMVIDLILAECVIHGGSFFTFLLALAFNVFLLYAACRLALCLRKLKEAGERLAEGDFETKLDTSDMRYDFKQHGEALNRVGDGMSLAVEQRMKSEHLKTELITNVSHDLKTPLTSIVNYVDLLQKEHIENEAARGYLEVLARQSARLRKLTEDLLEVSKASTGNVSVQCVPTNVVELLNQSLGEYSERFEAAKLVPVLNVPTQTPHIMADGRLLWRVFDNLLNNICKYSQPGTRIYCDVATSTGEVCISLKNISRDLLNVSAEELQERFVRGDSSRNSEGSGLGLAIASSLVELQHGKFNLFVDGDLFKAFLIFNEIPEPQSASVDASTTETENVGQE